MAIRPSKGFLHAVLRQGAAPSARAEEPAAQAFPSGADAARDLHPSPQALHVESSVENLLPARATVDERIINQPQTLTLRTSPDEAAINYALTHTDRTETDTAPYGSNSDKRPQPATAAPQR